MKKNALKWSCVASGLLFLILSALTVSAIMTALRQPTVSVIGGMGRPTLEFVLQQVTRSPIFLAALASFLAFVGTGIALIACRKK